MLKFKEQFNKLLKNISINKEDAVPYLISIVVAMLFFFGFQYFGQFLVGVLGTIAVILFIISIVMIASAAGYAVIESLFYVSAELSLLIFLAQSYCTVSRRSIASDEALKSLLVFGILYIIFSFFHSLCKLLMKNYKHIKKERRSNEGKVIVVLYFLLIGVFYMEHLFGYEPNLS